VKEEVKADAIIEPVVEEKVEEEKVAEETVWLSLND